jgi:hypothetical protein
MSSVSKRKGLSTSGSAVGVGAKRSKGGEARGNTNTEVGLKSPRVKDEATNRTHDVSKLPTTPIIQVQKSPVSVVKRINAGDHASSSIPQADTSATTSIGKDTKSDNDGHHSIGFLAVAYALAGLMALSWFDIPWTQHRCVVAAQAMGQATFSPEVWAALSWLGEGIRAQLYLYGPSDLALSENDPQPQLLLTHGACLATLTHVVSSFDLSGCALMSQRSSLSKLSSYLAELHVHACTQILSSIFRFHSWCICWILWSCLLSWLHRHSHVLRAHCIGVGHSRSAPMAKIAPNLPLQ